MGNLNLLVPQHTGSEDPAQIFADVKTDMTSLEASNNDLETRQLVVDGAAAQVTADAAQVAADRVQVASDKQAAETARTGAETAESNAVAVVTGGTASLTRAAGKIPIGDGNDGEIDWWNKYGMLGNIASPLVDIRLNQIELLPFASDSIAVGTPSDVTGWVGLLRTIIITTTLNPVPVLAAGHFATIGGVDYPVTAVAGTSVTLEYSASLADPVALSAAFSLWKLAGNYSGLSSFSRTSRKTYIDPLTGLIKAQPAGFPTFERMADGGIGLLQEGASTNLVLQSQEFSTGNWIQSNVTVTANTAVAPDGTITADTITANAANAEIYQQVSGGTANAAHTSALWIKRKTGTGNLYLFSPTAGRILITQTITSTEWTRVDKQATPTNTTPFTGIRIGTSGDEVYVWGAQIEALPFASSFIPTTTVAVTRAADSLTIPHSGNLVGVDDNMTVLMDVDMFGQTTMMEVFTVSSETYRIIRMNATYLQIYHGGVLIASGVNAWAKNIRYRIGAVADGTNVRGWIDGVQVSSGAQGAPGGAASSIVIGGNMYGHIRNMRIYDKALTDSEMAAA
jgi:hypothetical protein